MTTGNQYTEKQLSAVSALISHKNQSGQSNVEVASAVGVSTAMLSFFSRGLIDKYPTPDSELWSKIYAYLNTVAAPKQKLPLSGNLPLPRTKAIQRVLSWAHQQNDIALVYGIAGGGKTHAAREYTRKHSGCFYITASPATKAVYSFLSALAAQVGAEKANSASGAEAKILERLRRVGGDRILIVDEAHHLPQIVLDQIRCLYDSLENGDDGGAPSFGLALLGNSPLHATLHQRAAAPQLLGRIGRRMHLQFAGLENVMAVLQAAGADKKDKQLLEAATTIARSDGAIRTLIKVVRDTIIMATANDEPITAALLREAAMERLPTARVA